MLLQHAATTKDSALDRGPALYGDPAVGRQGEQIGPFVLLREIGKGGIGLVWLAERTDGLLKRRIAL